ncbi:MAG: LCP family protein [Mycoplasmatales bacterium]
MNLIKKKKKIRNLKILSLVLMLAAIWTCVLVAKDAVIAMASNVVIGDTKVGEALEPTTFLFIGSDEDQTNSAGARSDVLIVVTLTPSNSRGNMEVNMVSIPRDTVTHITCGDYYGRINEAYSVGFNESGTQGAVDCAVATVEEYLNTKIDYYAATSFTGLMGMIEAIGGVEIDVEYAFEEQDSGQNEKAISLQPGLQVLNGEQALAYARQRHYSSDYERGLRQQQIMMATAKKIMSNPGQYIPPAIGVFTKDMTSNLNIDVLTKLANNLVATYNTYIQNMSGNTPISVLIKTSPYTNETSISDTISGVTGVDTENIVEVPFSGFYPNAIDFELDTAVKEILFSKRASKMPSTKIIDGEEKPMIIEFQSISILANEFMNDNGASVSSPSPDTLYYVSNVLRTAVGLPIEKPTYNYSKIQ